MMHKLLINFTKLNIRQIILNIGIVALVFSPAEAQSEQLSSSNDSNNITAPKPSRAVYNIQSIFQPVTPVVPQTVASNVNAAPSLATAQESDSPFESFAYPLIKWKPRYVNGLPGAIIQLTTTFEYNPMKYKVILQTPRKPEWPHSFYFKFVDKNGFELYTFAISYSGFEAVPGTQLMEATGDDSFDKDLLRRIADYSVSY